MSKPFCRKCLLAETDLTGVYASVREMVAALPEWRKTSEAEYNRRLEICKSCDFLGEGTCENAVVMWICVLQDRKCTALMKITSGKG